jgi:hypothetical protein
MMDDYKYFKMFVLLVLGMALLLAINMNVKHYIKLQERTACYEASKVNPKLECKDETKTD